LQLAHGTLGVAQGWYRVAPSALGLSRTLWGTRVPHLVVWNRSAWVKSVKSATTASDPIYPLPMPQSLSFLLVHLIFSTKDRAPMLNVPVRPDLHAYLATVARNTNSECFRVGGVADHVHLAIRLSRTITVAQLLEELKTSSSKWLKSQSPALQHFAWQHGYGAFSVGPSDLDALVSSIDTQEEHHRRHSFQEEYRGFLKRYGVEFDERYVWD
jgi:REP element-mobilizing transposase RayT